MGWDFKAPRQDDIEQWRKVEALFNAGVTFHSCGCGGPGYRPATLKEVEPWLAEVEREHHMRRHTADVERRAEQLQKRRRQRHQARIEQRLRHQQTKLERRLRVENVVEQLDLNQLVRFQTPIDLVGESILAASVLTIKPTPIDEIEPGALVLVSLSKYLGFHRVMYIANDHILLDINEQKAEPLVEGRRIHGVVTAIEPAG